MIAYDISVFECIWCLDGVKVIFEQMDGAVVRALASHRCGPGSIRGPGVICGLSLLLVLVLAPRVFLWVLRFSSLHKNQHF